MIMAFVGMKKRTVSDMAYIDRTLVQKCLDDLSSENLIGNENDTFISLAEAKDRIEELPTADVVPKSEVERLTVNMNAFGLGMKAEKERADNAIKEFAERMKAEMRNLSAWQNGDATFYLVGDSFIDRIVKEMTEGKT